MKNLKITEGGWTRYRATIPSIDDPVSHSVYVGTKRIALCYDLFESDKSKNVSLEEGQANAQLIADAGTTANKCGKLPSELLAERDELLNQLVHLTYCLDYDVLQDSDYENTRKLIKKITGR